jgi:hypothetical protein
MRRYSRIGMIGGSGWIVVTSMALLAALTACALFGCGGGSGYTETEGPPTGDGAFSSGGDDGTHGSGALGEDLDAVCMCGRSVLGGWFEHWGWGYDPEEPVRFGSYYLFRHEMDSPPDIVNSAREAARAASRRGDEIMFFKLCFEDFAGGDEYGAQENLDANERIVREVAGAAVNGEGLMLILGNALPMVREYTDEWLVWNHREYNCYVEDLAGEYGGRVIILDLYGTLSSPGGWLRPEYAADPYDSHLNEAAYRALDAKLVEVLGGSP